MVITDNRKTQKYSLQIEMDSDALVDLIEITLAINTTPHNLAELFFLDIMGYGNDDERSQLAKQWFKMAIKGQQSE